MRKSAGILMHRARDGALEVLLVHPGGPYWKGKDEGAWSIPKGELTEGEEALDAARREFLEETGVVATGPFTELPALRQKSGKVLYAWAAPGDCDAATVRGNLFEMEWPPRSGKLERFPEVDRAGWFTLERARGKLLPGQVPWLDALAALLA